MKTIVASLLALLAAVASFAAESVPLFNATLTVGREHWFVLVGEAGKASPFLRLGDSFEGFTLKDYDAKAGTLGLERDGRTTRVALVTDAAIGHGMTATPATLADAESVMNAMNFDSMIEKMLGQSRKTQMGIVNQMMAQVTRSETDREAAMALQARLIDEIMGALKPAELKADMARIYSELFSKEELNGMAAFYSTPLGQKLSDRQPEVQEKLNAAIMPRIMAVMPKVRQMAQEFGAEQRARRAAAGAPEGAARARPDPAPSPKP